jgi:uncharacterized repeat protein (TIGR02543 family)
MKKINKLLFLYIFVFVMCVGVSFAWYIFKGDSLAIKVNFSGLDPYIKYSATTINEEDKTITPSSDYKGGVNNDITFNKEPEGKNLQLYGHVYLYVSSADSEVFKSSQLKWTLVSVTNSVETEISTGNFVGETVYQGEATSSNGMIPAYINFPLNNDSATTYKVYLWIDSNANANVDISGKNITVEIYSEASTESENNGGKYNEIYIRGIEYEGSVVKKLTLFSSIDSSISYGISSSKTTEPSSWITIDCSTNSLCKKDDKEPGYVIEVSNANLTIPSSSSYVWMKSSSGSKTIIKEVTRQDATMPSTDLCKKDLIYTGSSQQLVENTSGVGYTLSNYTGTNADNYTVTAKVSNNYTWSDGSTTDKTFVCSISKKAVTITANDQTITYGQTISSGVSNVTATGLVEGHSISAITLTPSTNQVTTSGTITASNATIKSGTTDVTSNYNIKYTSGKLTINALNISSADITLDTTTYTYDGSTKKPNATVKIGSTTLVKDTDYTVSYSNNTNANTSDNVPTVTITGKGNYTGTKSVTFTINKASNTITLTCNSLTYNTKAQQLLSSATATGGDVYVSVGTQLTSSNYSSAGSKTLSTATGTSQGNYTVYAYAPGNNNYNSTSANKVCTISQYDLSNATIKSIDAQTYTGSALTPAPTVTVPIPSGSTTTLVKDTDYTVSYSNNTNAGTATVTITGKGNYTNTKSTTFKINTATNTITLTCNTLTYNTSSQQLLSSATATGGDVYLSVGTELTSSNYSSAGSTTLSSITGTNASKYTVYAYTPGNSNYSSNTASKECTISQYDLSNASIASIADQTYTASALTPAPTVTVPIPSGSTTTLVKDTDYTVSYSDNTNAGTATVTITGKGNYTKTKSTTFKIAYKTFTITLDSQSANSAGTAKLYGRYADGIYLESSYTNKMTTSANKITVPTRTGYTFGGYYTSTNGSGTQMISDTGLITSNFTTTKYNSDVTLYAKWTINSYTVTYDFGTNGGTSSTKTSATVNYNAAIDLTPTATKDGWEFVGWNTSSTATTGLSSLTMGTENVTLYAIYKKTMTGTFYYYNGSSQTSTTSSCVLYNTATLCTYSTPSAVTSSTGPNGGSYLGISTAVNSTTTTTTVNSSQSTYYAIYKVTYTASFTKENNNVSSIGSTSLTCSSTATSNGATYSSPSCSITLPTITPASGYVATGWYNSSGTVVGVASDSISISSSATYTAKAKRLVASEFEYDNTNTGVDCDTIQCMIDKSDIIFASDLFYDNTNTGEDCDTAQCMIDKIDELIEGD